MPERIVDSIERADRRAVAMNQSERIDRGMAIAAILQTVPLFVWAAPLVLLFGFILMALWYQRGHLEDFTTGVLLWAARLLIGGGVCLLLVGLWKCYRLYHNFMIDASARRTMKANEKKALAVARQAELKNDQLQTKIDLEKQLPALIQWAVQNGYPVRYGKDGLEIQQVHLSPVRVSEISGNNPAQIEAGPVGAIAGPHLPTSVRYEDVRDRIPEGHSLLGVSSSGVVETCDFAQLMTMWICGGSSTGKSNTVGIKIEEAITNGRDLGIICIDYHARKSDSLYNKIRAYEDRFLMPVAYTEEAALVALQSFLTEFMKRRDVGSGARDILLVVDEVPAVLESEDEEIVRLLKKIARICGRESRGFGMFGWFISQNAVGLAWLRNVVLTVIAHKMNMLNEAILACNQHQDVARDMENWPRGRVIVYGLSFQGFKVLQMPLLTQSRQGRVVPAVESGDVAQKKTTVIEEVAAAQEQEEASDSPAPITPALTGDMRKVYDACAVLANAGERVSSRAVEGLIGIKKDKANGILDKLEQLGYIQRRKAV